MPELPDVEVFRRYAHQHALNKKITDIRYNDDKILDIGKQTLTKNIKDHKFTDSERRGKYVFLKSSSGKYLVLHFGMTGFLRYFSKEEEEPKYARVIFTFENDHNLACISKRKLGKIGLADDPEEYFKARKIGPDAFNISFSDFKKALSSKRGAIKTALMDQGTIAGIGNIYADEILYQEKIHPKTKLQELDEKQLKSLYNTMRRVFRTAINNDADPSALPGNYLLPHRDEKEDCPSCKGRIKKITVNGRGTYFCPSCQKE